MCFNLDQVIFSVDSKLRIIEKEAFDTCNFISFKIPPSVECIRSCAFFHCAKLLNVEIPPDSKLKTIESAVFVDTSIKNFTIPPSLTNLEDGWCNDTEFLTEIKILPNNPMYKLYDDKFIIGKSSIEMEEYEILIFCLRNVEKVTIPDFIKIIGPSSFQLCCKLKQISIPPQVVKICDYAFYYCNALQKVDIPTNSNLQYIGNGAFQGTLITDLFISSKVFNFKECFGQLNHLIKLNVSFDNLNFITIEDNLIIGKSNANSNEYDDLVFVNHDTRNITIPSFIKHIGPSIFSNHFNLEKVEIPLDSKLITIDRCAFERSKIKHINIPSSLKVIKSNAFAFCKNLHRFHIPQNSKLQIIENDAFYGSAIECFYIPPHVTKIDENVFCCCEMLKIIELDENSKISVIDFSIFDGLKNTLLMILADLRYKVTYVIEE